MIRFKPSFQWTDFRFVRLVMVIFMKLSIFESKMVDFRQTTVDFRAFCLLENTIFDWMKVFGECDTGKIRENQKKRIVNGIQLR